jgi:hypothetical protein
VGECAAGGLWVGVDTDHNRTDQILIRSDTDQNRTRYTSIAGEKWIMTGYG